MADERIVYEAVLETAKAARAAAEWEKRLDRMRKRERELSAQERSLAQSMEGLRTKLLALSRAELEGNIGKARYTRETKATRQALGEQAAAARRLRQEQAGLKRATADLRREEERRTRELERSTRAIRQHQAATERARARTARADARLRSTYQAQGAAGGRIEELQARIEELSGQRARLGTARGRAAARFGPQLRGAYERASSDEAFLGAAGRAVSGAPGFAARAVGVAAAGVGAVGGGVGAVAQVGAERERLKAGLSTALGSEREAEAAFAQIKRFATETPFAVGEVTDAVTKLKVRGLEPTIEAATESLRVYGDVAGAMGKDLDTVIEAVSDAALGEFERLKEAFNVVGRKAGDEVSFTFAGVTTTVKNDSESITNYLKELGRTNFAGGMAKQAQTLGGVWSNLGDAVSNFAEEVYQSGLGDALKEVLKDIIGNVDGADSLAKTIGENLADAVREGYQWLKDLLGPMDELPSKFDEAFETGKTFVGIVGDMVAVGLKLAETLGSGGVAMTAFVAAAAAAMGPLGALAAAATAVGYAIGSMLADTESHLSRLQNRVGDIRREAELAGLQAQADELQAEVEANEARYEYGRQTYQKLAESRMRAAGVSSIEELSSDEQVKLARAQLKAEQATTPEERAVIADLVTRSEGFADDREFARLKGIPKKKRTPSQEKRLRSLATKLDKKLPSGAGGKKTLSAAEAEQQASIDKAAKEAGLRAADEARLAGRGSEALAEGKRAEKETRERLKAQASRGEALPGEIDTAFARIAGYNEVGGAPPPPVIVNNYQFKVDVSVPVDARFDGTVDEFIDAVGDKLQVALEEKVFPDAALMIRGRVER